MRCESAWLTDRRYAPVTPRSVRANSLLPDGTKQAHSPGRLLLAFRTGQLVRKLSFSKQKKPPAAEGEEGASGAKPVRKFSFGRK